MSIHYYIRIKNYWRIEHNWIDQNWTELNILLKLSCNSEMYQNINDKKYCLSLQFDDWMI